MPPRKMDFMSSVLALADPVPLTVAILMQKSLTRVALDALMWTSLTGRLRSGNLGLVDGVRPMQLRLLHVPRRCRAALCAQPAMHAQVFVLHHDAPGLRQARRDVERLRQVLGRRLEALAQLALRAVVGNGETVDRADVDACVAFDAQLRAEHRLHVAVEAAL